MPPKSIPISKLRSLYRSRMLWDSCLEKYSPLQSSSCRPTAEYARDSFSKMHGRCYVLFNTERPVFSTPPSCTCHTEWRPSRYELSTNVYVPSAVKASSSDQTDYVEYCDPCPPFFIVNFGGEAQCRHRFTLRRHHMLLFCGWT